MHWAVVAPFIKKSCESGWLTPYVPGNRHQFNLIARPGTDRNWHNRPSPVTEPQEWREYWQQSGQALKITQGGVITVFPQLAATVGIRQSFSSRRFPVLAWWFNTNQYSGIKNWLAHNSLKHIDRFIVHNRCECEFYSKWLNIPPERFEFVPLQVREIPKTYPENKTEPYIIAAGSAYRDFPTLFQAVRKLGLRTIVISGPRALEGLDIPPEVETSFGLERPEIIRLIQQARINVVPMTTAGITAGTVTIAEAMRMGSALIVTRRSGVEDYITHGETGLLVEPYSVDDLVYAIDKLWHDEQLRNQLSASASRYAAENLSDQAAGAALGRVLDQIADSWGYN